MAGCCSISEPGSGQTPPERARRAVVTGGSRGLGLAIARRLAQHGWETTVASRQPQNLERARLEATAEGLALRTERVDVTSEDSVCELFARLDAEGPLHLVVNGAGANRSRLLVKASGGAPRVQAVKRHPLAEWEQTLRLCLTGAFIVGREAAATMLANGTSGAIINISSAARFGAYGQSAYSAAKAGLGALTYTWALELADHGIRVVAVAPGVVDGEALRERAAAQPRHAEYMERLRERVPLRRWATEEEIAQTVTFVAQNEYVTGTVLEVDGGGLPSRI